MISNKYYSKLRLSLIISRVDVPILGPDFGMSFYDLSKYLKSFLELYSELLILNRIYKKKYKEVRYNGFLHQ
jgi:hypothetical protein